MTRRRLNFLWRCHISYKLVVQVSCQFQDWFCNYDNFFFVKDLTRNPEIENTPVWVLSIIWRLGQVRVTKFGMNVSNKKFLMLKNAKFTTFTISELSPTHALRLELMFTFMTFLQWKRWSKNEMVRLYWTDDTILCYFPNSLMQGTNVILWIYKCDALHDLVSFV